MTMVTMKTENNYHILGFSTDIVPININSKMCLNDVMSTIAKVCVCVCLNNEIIPDQHMWNGLC